MLASLLGYSATIWRRSDHSEHEAWAPSSFTSDAAPFHRSSPLVSLLGRRIQARDPDRDRMPPAGTSSPTDARRHAAVVSEADARSGPYLLFSLPAVLPRPESLSALGDASHGRANPQPVLDA